MPYVSNAAHVRLGAILYTWGYLPIHKYRVIFQKAFSVIEIGIESTSLLLSPCVHSAGDLLCDTLCIWEKSIVHVKKIVFVDFAEN